ncbi:ClpXP protease specificity-enhancing factor [Pseudomonas matsuisoli]|uniref:Stringent starvation protein B n=1 Tax=Pseudomonas matsuisoli TaxID=1515666 RepID=A0A917Q3A2_9PSED|nr:ClpXP protease specificity-enhancing factor [Pseudomonas matsuisoli]GGK10137.1 stringent starvation protein B [Pseudomonas matsuisoli]
MTSSRPYLIRALYEWIVDNECTPHLLVGVEYPNVQVPDGYASEGQIVLNVSPSAVRHLNLGNDAVSFEGRFGGVAHNLFIPAAAVMAIYARENGQGMVFETEAPTVAEDAAPVAPEVDRGPKDEGPDDEPPRPSGRPSLKVVK